MAIYKWQTYLVATTYNVHVCCSRTKVNLYHTEGTNEGHNSIVDRYVSTLVITGKKALSEWRSVTVMLLCASA